MATLSVDPSKKTVGTTSLAAGGGSILGSAVATIILYFVPEHARMELFLPVTAVLTTVFALAGGYLSPSKAALIAPYITGLSDEISDRVAQVVPNSDTIADQVSSRVDQEGIASRVAELAPTADVPTREELADIVKNNSSSGAGSTAVNPAPVAPGVIPPHGDAGARAPENGDIVSAAELHDQVHAEMQEDEGYPDLDAYARVDTAEAASQ